MPRNLLASSTVAVALLLCTGAHAADAPPASEPAASEAPTAPPVPDRERGVIVQLRSFVATPTGGAVALPMQSVSHVIRSELVPLRLDLGYRFHNFYVGLFAQKSHGQTVSSRLTSTNGALSEPSVSDFGIGATAEYHFLSGRLIDPWFGIYAARRSIWLTSDTQGVRLKGPEAGLTAGFDVPAGAHLSFGMFLSAGYSLLSVSLDDDTHPMASHAIVGWFAGGLRGSWRL